MMPISSYIYVVVVIVMVVVLRVTYVFIILTKYSQVISGESDKQDLN